LFDAFTRLCTVRDNDFEPVKPEHPAVEQEGAHTV
jgi:hypothetical protein